MNRQRGGAFRADLLFLLAFVLLYLYLLWWLERNHYPVNTPLSIPRWRP